MLGLGLALNSALSSDKVVSVLFCFETSSCCVVQDGSELASLPSHLPRFWDSKHGTMPRPGECLSHVMWR